MSFFSVIVPLHNKANYIENTIKSILQQSFTDFELLIINDGSTDASEQKVIAFEDNRIKYFSKANGGASSARNYGIERALSNYITFMDADDYWYPHFLSDMFETIEQFSGQKVFAAAFEIETATSRFPAQYSIKKKASTQVVDYFDASCKTSVLWTSCAVFHKSVFGEIGVFDTTIKSGQDTDLWIRIGLVYPIVFNWKISARYVYDNQSLSKKQLEMDQKLNFLKFDTLEKTNPKLKTFLDLNRYAFAIKSKIQGNKTNVAHFKKTLDLKNLTVKKRILLQLPAFILKKLLSFNLLLVKMGWSQSVFK